MIKFFEQKNKGPAPYEAKSFRSGFTLVEVLVAIAIFSLAVTALMAALASGISNTTFAKQKMTATYLAQEGIEYVRNVRDNAILNPNNAGFDNFISAISFCGDVGCGFNDSLSLFSCGQNCELYLSNDSYEANGDNSGIDSGFKRILKFDINYNGQKEVKVTSTVSWGPSDKYSVQFSEDLFDWTEQPQNVIPQNGGSNGNDSQGNINPSPL